MIRVNRIIFHRDYINCLAKIEQEEIVRPFCGHDLEHFLSVARLTYILLLESGQTVIGKDIAYAAGLLHDIGRFREYRDRTDHALYSAELAEPLLEEADFGIEETRLIIEAIRQHRQDEERVVHRSPLSTALKKADMLSRLCFTCKVKESCIKIDKQPHKENLIY